MILAGDIGGTNTRLAVFENVNGRPKLLELEANAYGISELEESDFVVLNEGHSDPTGNAALISAGTGLGEAGLHNEDGRKMFQSR